jgi:tRNA_anti-like
MKTQKNITTLIIMFGLWSGLVFGCKTSTQRTSDATNAINISAEDLYKAYQSNEADADKVYQGKILIVSGTVGDTDTPAVGNAAVTLMAQKSAAIQCFGFAADQKDAVSKLKTGQNASVKGKCMGRMMGKLVVLEDSVLQ